MADLFNNNTSNDYIYPDLPQCPGASDTYTFEFLPGLQVGIVSGSSIISAMGLGDIMQPVTGWVQQTKILQPGELIFVQGLTKGITNRTQRFFIDDDASVTHSRDYISIDMSLNYYKNFRYYNSNISATSDYDNGIDIENALNLVFSDNGINITADYVDASSLSFSGSQAGYYFNITNIEASSFLPDTSIFGETLVEDVSSGLAAYKYPNSAMLGYVLKVTYTDIIESDKWIEINHVPDELVYYTTIDNSTYSQVTKTIDVGQSGISCDPDTMSAADYLDYVETHNLWEKVGPLRIWISADDPESSNTKNLIRGFYVFNPFGSPVQIDYMTIL